MVKLTPAMRKYDNWVMAWKSPLGLLLSEQAINRFYPDYEPIEEQLWAVREGLAD